MRTARSRFARPARGREQQRHLGRVALGAVAARLGVVAERERAQQQVPRRGTRPGRGRRRGGAAVDVKGLDPHAVLGQRAGLVRADVGDRAERLDRRQATDQRVGAHHLARAEGERDGHHRRQRLGNRRHGEADRGEEHEQRLLATQQADDEQDQAERDHRERQPLAEPGEPALQGRAAVLRATQQRRHAPELGLHAGRDDDPAPATVGHQRALERDVRAVAERQILVAEGLRARLDRLRLAGERRLVDAQLCRLEDADVRRHGAARLEQHHVPGHHVLARHHRCAAVTPDACLRRAERLQRKDRALGAILLDEAQHRVERQDDGDRQRILRLAEDARQHRARDQHQDHEVRELVEQHAQRAALPPLGETIRPEALAPERDFAARQTVRRRHRQGATDLVRGVDVPAAVARGGVAHLRRTAVRALRPPAARCVASRPIVRTGTGAWRTTFSATLPTSRCDSAPRPVVAMTMTSALSAAARMASSGGATTTLVRMRIARRPIVRATSFSRRSRSDSTRSSGGYQIGPPGGRMPASDVTGSSAQSAATSPPFSAARSHATSRA